MSDLSPRAQAVVDAARADESPLGTSKSRVKRRVLARVAAAAAVGTAAATTTKTAASLASGSAAGTASLASGGAATTAATLGGAKLVMGVALSALVAGSTATGVVVWRRSAAPAPVMQVGSRGAVPGDARTPRIAPALLTKPATVSPLPPIEAPMALAPSPAAPALAGGHHVQPASPGAAPLESRTESLEEELPLLQGAQRALRAGDPSQAIALLELHAKRFPEGALAEERRAVHAMASCRMDSATARDEADVFLRDEASSPLVERVREACARPGADGFVRGGGSR